MKYSPHQVLPSGLGALRRCDRSGRPALSSRDRGSGAIDEVPRSAVEAALAAFDTRCPGVPVLDLVADSRDSGSWAGERVLRYSDEVTTVVVTATDKEDRVQLSVVLQRETEGLVVAVQELAGSVTLVRRGRVPLVLDEVHHGLARLTGTLPGEDRPEWVTAWTRL